MTDQRFSIETCCTWTYFPPKMNVFNSGSIFNIWTHGSKRVSLTETRIRKNVCERVKSRIQIRNQGFVGADQGYAKVHAMYKSNQRFRRLNSEVPNGWSQRNQRSERPESGIRKFAEVEFTNGNKDPENLMQGLTHNGNKRPKGWNQGSTESGPWIPTNGIRYPRSAVRQIPHDECCQ